MKKIVLILFSILPLLSIAQVEYRSISFEEAITTAKKENKLLFVNASTTSCTTCEQMEMQVLSQSKVSDFLNQNFICVRYDFKNNRQDLASRFGVINFPSFLFISGDTLVANRASGFLDSTQLLAEAEKAITNSHGIAFTEGAWADIVKKAKESNKMIFVDCFTVWCGPCKVIARTVFKDPEVAALMNENFINIKVDMEKGEGIELKDKFEVSAFPTLLFLSPNGEVEHRIVGAVASKKFTEEAEKALAGEGFSAYQRKYKSGVRDTSFLKKYLNVLASSYKMDEAAAVAAEYLNKVGVTNLYNSESWEIFKEYCNDANSPIFSYVVEHQHEFESKYGEKEVAQKVEKVWRVHANSFVKRNGKVFEFDRKRFDEFVVYMQTKRVKDIDNIKLFALLNANFAIENWVEVANIISGGIKNGENFSLLHLYNWALRVDQKCTNDAVRKKAIEWVELGLKKAAVAPSGEMYISSLNKVKESLSKKKVQ